MKPAAKRLLAAVAVAAVLLGGFAYTRTKNRAPVAVPLATAPAVVELVAADLATAGARDLRLALPLTGTLKALNQTVVKTKVAGELSALPVREGETVKQGQLIARIDPTEYAWRVKQRQAALASAQASFALAQKTRANNQALLAQGFISQTAFDSASSQSDVARANVDAAVAELTLAQKLLDDSAIHAPMAGIVSERHAQPGEKLAVDGRIVTLVDLSRMEIEAPVPADRVGEVAIGQPVQLTVEGTQEKLQGRIARINPATTAGTRSIMVYIAVDNARGAARAGVFAQGELLLTARTARIAVPASSVREESGSPAVYVLEQGRLVHRSVRLGMQAAGADNLPWIEVVQGLNGGEQVIRQNTAQFRDGMTVRLAPSSAPSAAKS
jgi:membrane fusion protein (multidrug efflux system)